MDWSYEEFLSYIMLYAASADLEISDKEIDLIKQKSGNINFENVYAKFNSHSDYESIQAIAACKEKHFNSEQELNKVFEDMNKIFISDGHFDELEKNQLRALRHILV